MVTLSMTNTLTVAIAGLPITVQANDSVLVAQIATAYANFASDDLPRFGLEVLSAEGIESFGADQKSSPHLLVQGETVQIHEPTWHARLDLGLGEGQIWATERSQFEATDYTVRVVCAYLAFAAGGLLVHGAGLAHGAAGYLLLGPSGTGKTTAVRNAPQAHVLNDDLMLVMPSDQGWMLHATPFTNPSQVAPSGVMIAPLCAIFRLIQARHVARYSMGHASAAAEIIGLTPVLSLDPRQAPNVVRRAHQIATAVPCDYLELLPDPSYWAAILPPEAERTNP